MSGAEALFVVSLLANIFGIVDFTGKALGRIQESTSNLHDVPKAFRDVAMALPLLVDTLKTTQRRIGDGALEEETCKALRPVLEDCQAKFVELKSILDDCSPKESSSRLKRGCKAVLSLRQDKKVEEISHALSRHIQLLTLHHVAVKSNPDIDSLSLQISRTDLSASQEPKVHFLVPIQWCVFLYIVLNQTPFTCILKAPGDAFVEIETLKTPDGNG